MKSLIDKLERENTLSKEEWITLLESKIDTEYLFERARKVQSENYGNDVYIRGLIEISNYCKNDCLYCGIRCSNKNVKRYRLTKEEILSCCKNGYELGFRTFVLQGGEDKFYTDDLMCDIIKSIKKNHPDCAITLSIGEKTKETYQKYKNAGADRYLLRHETADKKHYQSLHPEKMSFENRQKCLFDLKEVGFQVGCGFMVGSPYQTSETLAKDMLFIKKLNPHMVGIGPFISQKDSPFKDMKNGSADKTLIFVALLRLMLPNALIPATTALGTLLEDGREKGILAGANVVMPNLSPKFAKENYTLYDNKLSTGCEEASHLLELKKRIEKIGYKIVISRGDYKERRK